MYIAHKDLKHKGTWKTESQTK